MIADALLLDLDGTILDSEKWYQESEVLAFRELGLEIRVEELEPFMGMTVEALVDAIAAAKGTEISYRAYRRIQRPLLQRMIRSKIKVYEDASRLLAESLHMCRAIVTSSPSWYLREAQKRFTEVASIRHSVTADDVTHGKPHPEPFLRACETLNVKPQNCVVIEDSFSGVTAALDAGCRVVAISRGADKGFPVGATVIESLAEFFRAVTA